MEEHLRPSLSSAISVYCIHIHLWPRTLIASFSGQSFLGHIHCLVEDIDIISHILLKSFDKDPLLHTTYLSKPHKIGIL